MSINCTEHTELQRYCNLSKYTKPSNITQDIFHMNYTIIENICKIIAMYKYYTLFALV